jgi:DNA-binding NarL/FixJ family response regulator
MIKLFVIDDHPIVIDGLYKMVQKQPDNLAIIGYAKSVPEAVQSVRPSDFDLFILDLYLPDSQPHENVRSLKEKFPTKKIIIFSSEYSNMWVRAMKKQCVSGYLTKDLDDWQIISSIIQVYNGESIFPNSSLSDTANNRKEIGLGHMFADPCQDRIISLLMEGLSVKEISDIIGINAFKINYILKKIRLQFKVKNNVELISSILKQRSSLINSQ